MELDSNKRQAEAMPTAHQQMPNKAIIMAGILFLLIVVGMFVFAYLKKTEVEPVINDSQPIDDSATRFDYIDRISGKHYYIDGVHTVVGEIPMPTPCDLLNAEAIVAESFPEQISLNFSVINNADSCDQIMTPARFKVEAPASAEATFSARLEGKSIPLNLTPAAPGELPEDFEVFIKG